MNSKRQGKQYLVLAASLQLFFVLFLYPIKVEAVGFEDLLQKSFLEKVKATIPVAPQNTNNLTSQEQESALSADSFKNNPPAPVTLQKVGASILKPFADIRSAIRSLFSSSSNSTVTLSPEEAQRIREKNSQLETTTPTPTTAPNVSVNGSSLFTQESQFRSGVRIQGTVRLDGDLLAPGRKIDLGNGTITASNILYSLIAGDGIRITGGQNATISSLYWTQNGNAIVPLDLTSNLGIGTTTPAATIGIGGNLYVSGASTSTFEGTLRVLGALNTGSILLRNNAIKFSATSTILIPNSSSFRVGTSTGREILSVSSAGRGRVSVGSTTSSALFSVFGTNESVPLFSLVKNNTTNF